jgi:hypothetical protein
MAQKAPLGSGAKVGGNRSGREAPIDEKGLTARSLISCDGDHKYVLSISLVEKSRSDFGGGRLDRRHEQAWSALP